MQPIIGARLKSQVKQLYYKEVLCFSSIEELEFSSLKTCAHVSVLNELIWKKL